MTTKAAIDRPLPANPPGWKGMAYYTSGKVGEGPCFGIDTVPIYRAGKPTGDLAVIFPRKEESKPQQVAIQQKQEPVTNAKVIHPSTPIENVTDISSNKCLVCGLPVPGKRIDRHYCSPRCRKRASRGGKQLSLAR